MRPQALDRRSSAAQAMLIASLPIAGCGGGGVSAQGAPATQSLFNARRRVLLRSFFNRPL